MPPSSAEITALLRAWSDGEEKALDDLMPLVFDDLRKIASEYLRGERPDTLQSTALVREVFVRLLSRKSLSWKDRSQFFGFIAKEIWRILVDHARRRKAARRGRGRRPVSLAPALEVAQKRNIDLLKLDDALEALGNLSPDLVQVVELRFFVGLDYRQIADIQETSVATVRRRWAEARVWLYRELASDQGDPSGAATGNP